MKVERKKEKELQEKKSRQKGMRRKKRKRKKSIEGKGKKEHRRNVVGRKWEGKKDTEDE